MSSELNGEGPRKSARRVFVLLIVIAIVLLVLIIRPFAEAFILAAVLAGALYPLQRRLTRRLRGRQTIAAGLLCFLVIVTLVVPLGGIAAVVVRELAEGARFVSETVRSEGMEGLVDRLPDSIEGTIQKLIHRLPVAEDGLEKTVEEQVSTQSSKAAKAVGGVVVATGSIAVQAAMMLIALFFLLLDGQRLVAWFEEVSPLKRGQTTEILLEFRNVSVAVLVSAIATAGVQAITALIGYLVARVPQPFFFMMLTFFIAFIPAIGAAGVCLAAAGLLLITGRPVAAVFLAIYAVTVVALVDNIVKPLLVKRGMHLHGAIVFFALLGGLAAFGTVGLLVGPVIVAFFLALIRIYERDYGEQKTVPQVVTPPT